MALRILVTAKDAGSAYQNRAFIKICLDEGYEVDFRAIVEGTAIKIFSDLPVQCSSVDISKSFDVGRFKKQLKEIFIDHKPDFVLLGLSGYECGIDEITREFCKLYNISCGVIQDYWGSIGNYSRSELPDIFFCMNKDAKYITETLSGENARCIVTGSPKHQLYKNNIHDWVNKKPVECNRKNIILFVGQPDYIPGVKVNFEVFLDCLAKVSDCHIIYKPHPGDDASIYQYKELLDDQIHSYEIADTGMPIEALLCNTDLVVTCFSSAGIDHNYLQLLVDYPLGSLLYLLIGQELQTYIKDRFGKLIIPGSQYGLGLICKDKSALPSIVQRGLQERHDYKNAVYSYFNNNLYQNPTNEIYTIVQTLR